VGSRDFISNILGLIDKPAKRNSTAEKAIRDKERLTVTRCLNETLLGVEHKNAVRDVHPIIFSIKNRRVGITVIEKI
jgi:hypothetical protein